MNATTKNLKEVELHVWEALHDSTKCRNSDFMLIINIMKRYGQKVEARYNIMTQEQRIEWTITNWKELPSFESITRARRKIQAGRQFLPTDIEVMRQRRINEQRIKKYYQGKL